MAASRTISIRLGVDGSQEIKSALEGLRADVDATSQRVKASLEGLSSGDVGGKLASQLTAAATRIAALQKALGDASASGNTEAQVAIQNKLTTAMQGYAAVLDRAAASVSPLAAAEQTRTKALFDATNAVKAAAIAEDEGAAARLRAQGTYDKQIKAIQDYAAAAQAAKAIVISSPGFSFAQDRGADIAAYGAELDRLRAKFNPLFAASKQYEGLLSEISDAERVGAISASEAAQAREAATAAFAKSNAPIIASTAALKDYAAAADAAKSLIVSSPGFSPAQDRGANIAAYGAELDKLRAKYDPLFAASKQYESLLEGISDAERVGAISANVAAKARENATIAFAQSNGPIIASTAALKDYAAAANAAKSLVISSPGFSFAQDRGADIAAYGAEMDKLRAKYNPLFAAERQYRTELEGVAEALKVGAINEAEAARARQTAASDFQKASAVATTASSAMKKTADSTDNLSGSTRNASTQLRLLGVQAIQTASGLATGQPILTTLIQQGHQVADSLLATGTGFGALKGAVGSAISAIGPLNIALVAGAAAFYELVKAGETSASMLANVQQSLRGNQENFESLGETVVGVGRRIAATSGLGLSEAVKVAQQFQNNRFFSGTAQDLERLSRDAIDLGARMGGDAALGAKLLSEAMLDPSKSAQELSKEFSKFLTSGSGGFLEWVKGVQDAGHQSEAFEALLKKLELGMSGFANNSIGPIAKAWQDLGNSLTSSQDGWKPLTSWLANDFAQTIHEVTDLVNSLKDAWNAVGDSFHRLTTTEMTDKADELVRRRMAGQQNRNSLAPPAPGPLPLPSPNDVGGPGGLTASGPGPGQVWATLTASASREAFVSTWLDAAKQAGTQIGVSPEIILSQLAQETGYGRSAYNYNLGNIKPGSNYQGNTFVNPGDNLAYRAYSSPSEFMADYVGVLQRRFPGVVGTGSDVNAFTSALGYGRPGGYAEDPKYGSKVASVYDQVRGLTATAATNALPLDDLMSRVNQVVNGGQFAGGNGGMLSNTKALAESIDAARKATQDFKAANLTELLEALHTKQDEVAASAGKDSAEYRQLTQVEQNLVAQVSANVDARTKEQQSAERALQSSAGLTAAEQKLNAALVQRQQALIAAGQAFTSTDAEQVRTNVLNEQLQALGKLEYQMAHTSAKNRELTEAYGKGNEAVVTATAEQQAYDKALELFGRNIPADKLKELTAFYRDAARGAANLATAQQNAELRDNLTYIAAETTSLGENVDQRNKELAVLKATLAMHNKFGDNLTDEAKKYIELTGTVADATAAFQHQQGALQEISGFFTNTFDTISTAITQAFATGNLQALKFKDIMHSVASAVLSEFAKLAILNPLKNMLFGENNQTLSSVGGIIGKLFGGAGGGIDSGGVSTLLGLAGGAASLFGGNSSPSPAGVGFNSSVGQNSLAQGLNLVSTLTGATGVTNTANGKSADIGGSGGGFSVLSAAGLGSTLLGLGEKLGITGAGGIVSKLTDTVKAISNYSLYSSGAVGEAAGTTGATVQALDGINVTLGSAVGAIGGIYSAIQGFQRGGVGGAVQGVAGIAGAGLAVAGTGVLGAGAAGLAAAAGPYAPIALAAIAIIGALLPGGHPLHPFDATAVDAQDGKLAVGKTATQAMQATSLSTVTSFVQGVNEFMSQAHLILENGNGQLGAIGQGIAGMVGLVTDPNKILETLRFKNDPGDTSQFGVAKGALEGMSFPNAQALTDELIKIASFADATAALGVRLRAVGQDLTNIQIASVDGANASTTGTTTGANGESVSYLNDLRTALNNDLPRQTYASVQALDDEINKVNQFVNGSIPGLLHPIEQTTSSIVDASNKIMETYQTAIDQSVQYGLDNTAVLRNAEEEALAIVRRSGVEQLTATANQIRDRNRVATIGGVYTAAEQTVNNFDAQAQQQRDAFSKLWTDTYGDGIKATSWYLDSINALEQTLGAERVKIVQQVWQQIADAIQAVADNDNSLWARRASAVGDPQTAELINFNVKASQEAKTFSAQLLATYGDAFQATEGYAAQMALLESTLGVERVAIMKKYADQQLAAVQGIADADQGLWARLAAANGDQKTSDLLNFDTKAAQERNTFSAQLLSTYGASFQSTQGYADQMALLESTLGAERLAIVQKYGTAVNGATADQLKAAQGSVASLFTSLSDYVTKLQSGTNSPLSPTAQYGLAKGQFNAVAGAAAAGDATSAGKLTGFADSFLSASRAVYGSGVGYATDFNRVLDAIQHVVQAPTDALTNSFLALQLQQQTVSITQAQQATTDAINALRREIQQQARAAA